ncbi:MAG: hypothetical protein NTW29_07475 [Bacteroidetes bacterium]|nr:hypothetical protein [Bacteroidota bacterium]
MKKELNRLSEDIRALILSGEKVKTPSNELLSQVFNLRIKAVKWLSADTHLDINAMLREILVRVEELKSDIRLEVLTENILFALRCNQRVLDSVINNKEFGLNTKDIDFTQLPDITYPQFIAALNYANLGNETVHKLVDWTNASLHIEFVLVAADIIFDEKLKVTDNTIRQLAFMVADAAQEYSALAAELGFLKSNSGNASSTNLSFDNSFIREQKNIADLGLDDFALNFSN